MTTPRPRYAYIERLAERLLGEAGVIQPPVPVEGMARKTGCKVIAAKLRDVSGVLVRSRNGATIGYNSDHPQTRKRFTIAHELGHFLLHRGQEVRYDHDFRVSLRSQESSEGTNIEEIEANFFAASLLMPEKILAADPRTAFIHLDDDATVEALAKSYKVSRQAMSLRLTRLLNRGF